MLKFVGMLLVLGGSTGIGISMAKELDQRIEELRILQQLILALRGEIRYRHLPRLLTVSLTMWQRSWSAEKGTRRKRSGNGI